MKMNKFIFTIEGEISILALDEDQAKQFAANQLNTLHSKFNFKIKDVVVEDILFGDEQ